SPKFRRDPKQISQPLRSLNTQLRDVFEADPEIIRTRNHFQTRANPRIAIRNGRERFPIQNSSHLRRIEYRRLNRTLLEHLLPSTFRIDRPTIQQTREHRVVVLVTKQIELLFCAVKFSREAEQLE